MFENDINRAATLLSASRYTVALTGAGISTSSGIPDFRSPRAGLWENADPQEVATLWGFRHNPAAFYNCLRPLARTVLDARPNPAHLALARLEALGVLKAVITQNVDMLHSKAGNKVVYEIHGHMREATCIRCNSVCDARPHIDAFIDDGTVPSCPACGGTLKPNVVLFGEELPVREIDDAYRAARECDVMIVAGSSLEVYPAGNLPSAAAMNNAKLIVVNYEPTHVDHLAEVVIHADVAEVLPRVVDALDERVGSQTR